MVSPHHHSMLQSLFASGLWSYYIDLINLFPHIVGTTLGGSQMYLRLVFHTFAEKPLVQGLQCPNNRVLQGSHHHVLPLCLFGGEFGHPIGEGGVLP